MLLCTSFINENAVVEKRILQDPSRTDTEYAAALYVNGR